MKKKESKKFSLEKFEVVKLQNSNLVFGGTGSEDDDATNTDNDKNKPKGTSIPCKIKDLVDF
ncbi:MULTISPECIES: hypothetical protein [Flavobacterium]|uniref:Uncharacterized protein n=1 Tax=Flavobacterium jumunjinense TaxID=998845 RepID=A0ABV5GQ74_9FLAO|nr:MULTISPECIES: hypothetical protein [Flavobacterium]